MTELPEGSIRIGVVFLPEREDGKIEYVVVGEHRDNRAYIEQTTTEKNVELSLGITVNEVRKRLKT